MKINGAYIQDSFTPVAGASPGLLDDQGQRRRLIEKSKLPLRVLGFTGL
jgi:hypothetical protein